MEQRNFKTSFLAPNRPVKIDWYWVVRQTRAKQRGVLVGKSGAATDLVPGLLFLLLVPLEITHVAVVVREPGTLRSAAVVLRSVPVLFRPENRRQDGDAWVLLGDRPRTCEKTFSGHDQRLGSMTCRAVGQWANSVNRNAGERGNDGGVDPSSLSKRGGGQRGLRCLFTTASSVMSWFSKKDLKQIYCSYSRTQKIQNGFLKICHHF